MWNQPIHTQSSQKGCPEAPYIEQDYQETKEEVDVKVGWEKWEGGTLDESG